MQSDTFKNLANSLGEYYRLVVSSRRINDEYWLARFSIRRCDTDEEVDGAQVSGSTEEIALSRLEARVEGYVPAISPIPREWNKIEVRSLLLDYRKFEDELSSLLLEVKESLASGNLQEDFLGKTFRKVQERCIGNAVDFSRRLEGLSESDLIELMTSSEEAYINRQNPYHIDDLYGRAALFDFIINPKPSIVAAHNIHMNRLDDTG